jgi:hypothetical protein
MTSADGQSKINLGKWNADLVWLNDNVMALNYSNGSPCLGNDSLARRNTLIRLQCFEAQSPNQIVPSFVGECTTVLDLYTPLTCKHTVSSKVATPEFRLLIQFLFTKVFCGVEENGKHFDLSPLMNFERNYEISVGQLPTYNYIINVCKSLVRTPGLKECLPEYSAVCKARGLAEDSFKVICRISPSVSPVGILSALSEHVQPWLCHGPAVYERAERAGHSLSARNRVPAGEEGIELLLGDPLHLRPRNLSRASGAFR